MRAFITLSRDAALEAARASDARRRAGQPRPLEGLPFAVKDLTQTAGVRTTFGSIDLREQCARTGRDLRCPIEAAGAVLVGKTNTPEFGFGPRTTNALCGPTANPYDAGRTSGGSCGGSAAAVAAGMVPLAQGTDFGGSVRTPASFCGVVGLRPTPGVIPNGSKLLAWNTLSLTG